MEITLQNEQLMLREMAAQKETELQVESDIIVPDQKPDIARILQMEGRARITSCQRQGDKVFINGLADYHLLYVPEGEDAAMLESMEIQLPFKDVIGPFAGTEDDISAMAETGSTECMVRNSRKFSVKGMVKVFLLAKKAREVRLCVGAEGEPLPQMKKKKCAVRSDAAEGVFPATVGMTEMVPAENPPMAEVLKTDAQIFEDDVKLITGKMLVKGRVRLRTLYKSALPGGQPGVMEHAIPFTEILDLPGTEEGMDYTLDCRVTDIYCEVDTDDEEGRRFGVEVAMEMRAATMQNTEIEMLTDCYCPGMKTEMKKERICLQTASEAIADSVAVRQTISLPETYAPILAVQTISANPVVTSVTVDGARAEVSGMAEVKILYMTDGGMYPLEAYTDRIPFSFTLPTTAAPDAEISCRTRMADCGFTLPDAGSVDVRLSMEVDLRLTSKSDVETVSEILVSEEEAGRRPSVVIAFPAPGDTLWDIGKRYGVEIEKIAAANGISADAPLMEKTRLLVP